MMKKMMSVLLSMFMIVSLTFTFNVYPCNHVSATTITSKENVKTYATSNSKINKYQKQVLKLVNKQRKKRGLSAYKLKKSLSKAALIRTKELPKCFDHTRPDGSECFTVFEDLNISYSAVGENIAAGQMTPKQVVYSWMHSSGHKANILSKKYKYMGVGFWKSSSGYKYYWAQEFLG